MRPGASPLEVLYRGHVQQEKSDDPDTKSLCLVAQSRLLPIPGLRPAAVKREVDRNQADNSLSGLRKEA